MARGRWTVEEVRRRSRILRNILEMLIGFVIANERRKPGAFVTRADAIHVIRRAQRNVFRRFKRRHGAETARRYRRLVHAILDELQRDVVR